MESINSEFLHVLFMDEDKVSSLVSQIYSGIQTEESLTEGIDSNSEGEINVGFNWFGANARRGGSRSRSTSLSRVPHHYVVKKLIDGLRKNGIIYECDVDENIDLSDYLFRAKLTLQPIIKVNGLVSLDSFPVVARRAEIIQDVLPFFRWISQSNDSEINKYSEQIETLELQQGAATGEEAYLLKKQARALKQTRQALIDNITAQSKIAPELIEGLGKLASTILKDEWLFRIYPKDYNPLLQVVCRMPNTKFNFDAFEELIACYGSYPNVRLTAIVMTTSVPLPQQQFDSRFISPELHLSEVLANFPADEKDNAVYKYMEEAKGNMTFETALQSIAPLWDSMLMTIRPNYYPRIIGQPIVIYREIISDVDPRMLELETLVLKGLEGSVDDELTENVE